MPKATRSRALLHWGRLVARSKARTAAGNRIKRKSRTELFAVTLIDLDFGEEQAHTRAIACYQQLMVHTAQHMPFEDLTAQEQLVVLQCMKATAAHVVYCDVVTDEMAQASEKITALALNAR